MAIDTSVTVFGVSAVAFLLIGLAVFYLGTRSGKGVLGFTPRQAGVAKVVGAVFILLSAGAMLGITLIDETADISDMRIKVTAAEDTDQTYIEIDNGDKKVTWEVHFNYTGDGAFLNSTNTATLNFTLTRVDESSKDHVVKCYVSDKGSVVDEATGNTYYLINKGLAWDIDWTKAGATENSVVSTPDSDELTLALDHGGSA